jgi:hypothetical protein
MNRASFLVADIRMLWLPAAAILLGLDQASVQIPRERVSRERSLFRWSAV